MYSNMSDLCPTPIGLIGPSGCNCTIDTTKGIVVVDKQTLYNTTYRVPPGDGNCCTGFTKGRDSFPRNMRGRWNNTNTNTKMYPIIYECKTDPFCDGCDLVNPAPNRVRTTVRSGNLFSNTAARMSQRKMYSFLVRNRHMINR